MILYLLVTAFFFKKQPPIQTVSPTPQPTVIQTGDLKVLSVYPPPDKLDEISQGTRITVTFNQIIDSQTFKYTSSPPLEIVTDFATSSVTFRPKTFWPLDTKVTITILYAKGDKGAVLTKPYQIEFMSPAPTGL